MALLDKIPLMYLLIGAVFLGLAPFFPEPHLVEKTRMLINGTLVRPIDMLDLAMHAVLPGLLVIKLARMVLISN